MSESMTVEHATEMAKKFAALARANEDLCRHAIKQRDTLQARVAELEAEKWNAQIAEAALASVEQERDELAAKCADFIDTAQHAYDYWNGDYNEQAMGNALDTIMELLISIVGDPPEKLLLARIKAEAVREAYRHVNDTVSLQFCSEEYSEGFGDAMDYVEAYANQIEGGA